MALACAERLTGLLERQRVVLSNALDTVPLPHRRQRRRRHPPRYLPEEGEADEEVYCDNDDNESINAGGWSSSPAEISHRRVARLLNTGAFIGA